MVMKTTDTKTGLLYDGNLHVKLVVFPLMMLIVPFIVGSDYIWREDIAKGVDRSTYRCAYGLVAKGDLMRDVLEKCGEPVRRASMQLDPNSIWIYRPGNSDQIVYMAFANERLQRIHSARCWEENPHCD